MNARVLIAEDEGLVALELQSIVAEAGYTVIGPVSRVYAALELADLCKPAVALLDINLRSRMSGLDLGSRLKNQFRTDVVFITGETDPSLLARAAAIEPAALLSKPAMPAQVIHAIELALCPLHRRATAPAVPVA